MATPWRGRSVKMEARPSTEREVGEARAFGGMLRREAIRVEAFGILTEVRVTVREVGVQENARAAHQRRRKPTATECWIRS